MIVAFQDEIMHKMQKQPEKNAKAFKRASKFLDYSEMEKLQPISVRFQKKHRKSLPKRTKTLLPKSEQVSYKRLKQINTLVTFLLSAIIIIGCIFECESTSETDYKLSEHNNAIRIVLAGLAVIQILFIILYSWVDFKISISYKIISKKSSLYQHKSILYRLLLETIICCIVFPPFFMFKINVKQPYVSQVVSLDDLLIGLVFLRIVHLYKVYYEFCFFNSLRSRFYCDIEQVENIPIFTMKCFLKDMPFLSLLIMFTFSTLFFGLLLHFYEYSVVKSPFVDVWNSFWLISYTQSTIGYGDITPLTHLGRFSVILCTLIGVYMYSNIVLNVQISTSLSKKEIRLYTSIKYRKIECKKLSVPAALLIQQWWILLQKRKAKTSSFKDCYLFRKLLRRFSFIRLKAHQASNPTLEDEIKEIKTPLSKLVNLTRSLESIKKSEDLSVRLSSLVHSNTNNIRIALKKMRKSCGREESRRNNANRKTSNIGNAALKKIKENAVKKMMINKLEKSGLAVSKSSLSSDEDFYSSRNSGPIV